MEGIVLYIYNTAIWKPCMYGESRFSWSHTATVLTFVAIILIILSPCTCMYYIATLNTEPIHADDVAAQSNAHHGNNIELNWTLAVPILLLLSTGLINFVII